MPSYNYECRDCGTELIFTHPEEFKVAPKDLYCERCGSTHLDLIEYSKNNDLKSSRLIEEIQDIHTRISSLKSEIESLASRVEYLEDILPGDTDEKPVTLLN